MKRKRRGLDRAADSDAAMPPRGLWPWWRKSMQFIAETRVPPLIRCNQVAASRPHTPFPPEHFAIVAVAPPSGAFIGVVQ